MGRNFVFGCVFFFFVFTQNRVLVWLSLVYFIINYYMQSFVHFKASDFLPLSPSCLQNCSLCVFIWYLECLVIHSKKAEMAKTLALRLKVDLLLTIFGGTN